MPTTARGYRYKLVERPRLHVREGLHPRVIYFPAGIIDEHDREPGQLIELVTRALSAYLTDGKGVRP